MTWCQRVTPLGERRAEIGVLFNAAHQGGQGSRITCREKSRIVLPEQAGVASEITGNNWQARQTGLRDNIGATFHDRANDRLRQLAYRDVTQIYD